MSTKLGRFSLVSIVSEGVSRLFKISRLVRCAETNILSSCGWVGILWPKRCSRACKRCGLQWYFAVHPTRDVLSKHIAPSVEKLASFNARGLNHKNCNHPKTDPFERRTRNGRENVHVTSICWIAFLSGKEMTAYNSTISHTSLYLLTVWKCGISNSPKTVDINFCVICKARGLQVNFFA